MSKLHFNSAEEAQRAYDSFAERHTKAVNDSQRAITNIINGKVPRIGATVDKVLEQASNNQIELLKSTIGYINQTKKAECNYQYERADRKRVERYLLPTDKTYCCVMKEPIPSRKEDIEKAGLKEKDLSILFRLIPCVWFNTGILVNPDNGIPFITVADVAEYLGENPSSDGAVAKAIRRLIQSDILWRYGNLFIMNDYWIRCGAMTSGVLTTRHNTLKKHKDRQGKKATQELGKKAVTKKAKKDVAKLPQTQATSGQEENEKIPF